MFEAIKADFDHYRRYFRRTDAAFFFLIRTIYCHPACLGVIWYRLGRFSLEIKSPLTSNLLKIIYYIGFPPVRLYSGVQISLAAEIAPGLAILHFGGVVIATGTKMGADCLLHHNVNLVAYNSSKGPNIGARFYAGVGVTVIDNITIEDDVSAGAGSIVTKSIPKDAFVAGVPAKIIRFRNPQESPAENSTYAHEKKWMTHPKPPTP